MTTIWHTDRPDTCCSCCGSREHSLENCDQVTLGRETRQASNRYRVEEYKELMPTGRSWELNAPDAIHATSNATGKTAHSGVKRGALALKVMLAGDSSQGVEWFYLSE